MATSGRRVRRTSSSTRPASPTSPSGSTTASRTPRSAPPSRPPTGSRPPCSTCAAPRTRPPRSPPAPRPGCGARTSSPRPRPRCSTSPPGCRATSCPAPRARARPGWRWSRRDAGRRPASACAWCPTAGAWRRAWPGRWPTCPSASDRRSPAPSTSWAGRGGLPRRGMRARRSGRSTPHDGCWQRHGSCPRRSGSPPSSSTRPRTSRTRGGRPCWPLPATTPSAWPCCVTTSRRCSPSAAGAPTSSCPASASPRTCATPCRWSTPSARS